MSGADPGDPAGGGPDGVAEPPATVALPSGRRRHLLSAVSLVLTLAVVAVGVGYVVVRREEVLASLADIGLGAALLCTALTVLGVLLTGESWRVWLGSLATAPPASTSHRIFYLTQSGKYLPGSLWPVLTQVALARRYGVRRSAMLSATSLFLLTHLVTGTVVGVAGAGAGVASQWAWLIYPVAGLGLLALTPPVLRRAVDVLDRRRGLTVASPSPSWSAVGRATGLMLLAWLAYGCATWLLTLGPSARGGSGEASLQLVVGAYALAWVVGFLAVAAPAGVGAREAVLVAVLAPTLGGPAAFSVALVSRVALAVADLSLAAVSSGVLRERKQLPSSG